MQINAPRGNRPAGAPRVGRSRFVALFAIAAVFILALGVAVYWYAARRIRLEWKQRLADVARGRAETLSEWAVEKLGDARRCAQQVGIGRTSFLSRKIPYITDTLGSSLAAEMSIRGSYAVRLINNDGSIAWSSPEATTELDEATSLAVRSAVSKRGSAFSTVYRVAGTSTALVDTVAVVPDASETSQSVLVLTSRIDTLFQRLFESQYSNDASCDLIVVCPDTSGSPSLVFHSIRSDPYRMKMVSAQECNVTKAFGEFVTKGEFGITTTYLGNPVLASSMEVDATNWWVAATIETREVRRQTYDEMALALIGTVLLFGLASAIVGLLYRKDQVRLYESLLLEQQVRRAHDEELRTTLYSIADAVVTTDVNANVVRMNNEAERLTGWAETEAKGRPLAEILRLLHEDGREFKLPSFSELVTEAGTTCSAYLVSKCGAHTPISKSVAPIKPANDSPTGLVVVFRDQTAERAVADEILRNSRRLERAEENAWLGGWEYDLVRGHVWWSPMMYKLLGLEVNSAIPSKHGILKRIHPDDRDKIGYALHQMMARETPSVTEFRTNPAQGRERILSPRVQVVRNADGHAVAYSGTVLDITELRRYEDALRESEEKYRTIVTHEPVCVKITDLDGRVIEMNPAGLRMLNAANLEDLQRTPMLEKIHPDDRESFIQLTERCIAGNTEKMDLRLQRDDGDLTWVETHVTPLYDRNGLVKSLLSLTRDVTDQRRAAQALSESEKRHRLLFESNPQPMWVFDQNSLSFIAVNQTAIDAYGYTELEFLSMTIRDLVPATNPDTLTEIIRSPDVPKKVQCVVRHRTKSGEVIDVEVHADKANFGGRLAWIVLASNVTQRLAVEQDLQVRMRQQAAVAELGQLAGRFPSRQELLAQAVDLLGNAINAEFVQVFRLDEPNAKLDLVAGRGWDSEFINTFAVPADDRSQCGYTLRMGNPVTVTDIETENRFRWPTMCRELKLRSGLSVVISAGGEAWGVLAAHSRSVRSFSDHDVHFFTSMANILGEAIQRETFEVERQAVMARLNAFLKHSPLVICEVDYSGKFLLVNETLCSYVRRSEHELLSLSMHDIFSPEDAARFVTYLDRFRNNPVAVTRTETLDLPDGHRIFNLVAFPMLDANGRAVSIACVAEDITAKVRAEQERAALEEQFRQSQKMEAVGRLAGGIAHDFNNMLNVILNYAEVALRRVPHNSELREDIEEILKAGQRSAELTRQLLAFARRQTIVPRVLDLNNTIQGTLNMLGRLIGEDIKLVWNPYQGLQPVYADPAQIDQVLANLVVNARDAIVGVGLIEIRTGTEVVGTTTHEHHPDAIPGTYSYLSIRDNGAGIDKETMDKIFEPFFTTKPRGKGTGLGLAMVYGIAQQNGGFITVDSTLGSGTTFTFYLPVHDAPNTDAQPLPTVEEPVGGFETVLLVEDEPSLLKLCTRLLMQLGYKVLAADGPVAALQVLKEHHGGIDVLMTDVIMPTMSGLDLQRKVLDAYPALVTVFMSGYTADVIGDHGGLSEGNVFLQKPFVLSELSFKLRQALSARRNAADDQPSID